MAQTDLIVSPVSDKAELDDFIDCAYRLNASDPNWVPPIRSEVVELLTPGKNPFHDHADVQLFVARRGGRPVGRISAHIDHLALAQPPEQGMGPGTGNWGLFEAEDEETGKALILTAENWLREKGMTRVLAPISLSIWEEPGLLVKGHDHPPTVMMGHHSPRYHGWIEAAGYSFAKSLKTWELDISRDFPPLIGRIVKSGERNERIVIRQVDTRKFESEARIVIDILNDAWSGNWGFVPFTDEEAAYGAKKMAPLIRPDLNMIAELDGRPVAFMMTWPDANEPIKA
ncbi:MAG TPA: N-acetyltransferase, partial [Sphingomonadaceae bacterium]|nr:N-acetyltransferase [Sphingomonadaceae bacterium]